MQTLRCSLMVGVFTCFCMAQQPRAASPPQKMQIVLEQQVGKTTHVVNPQHVFKTGDLVRFRFRSSFDGYLYVTDRAASGKYLTLFPGEKAGTDNRLVRGKDYLIPSAAGSWFRIDNPAGYETVFFVVTTVRPDEKTRVQAPLLAPPPAEPSPDDMQPRCDDEIFRARGECLDANAGASALPPHQGTEGDAGSKENMTPRDIVVIRKTDSSVVAPTTSGDAPIIYQFRIAHR